MKNSMSFIIGLAIGGAVAYYVCTKLHSEEVFNGSNEIGARNISAAEANKLFKTYHDSKEDKLKVTLKGDSGNTSVRNIKTFILDQEIINYFEVLVADAVDKNPKMEAEGLALTLGRDESKSSTLIITALVSVPEDNGSGERIVEHLLPEDEHDKTYIYDYIDLCPHTCPKNDFPLTQEEYDENSINNTPYDPNKNYWVKQ